MSAAREALIKNSAIATWLGFSSEEIDGQKCYRLTFGEQHIGNPAIRALHGGAIAAFLELASQCAVTDHLKDDTKITTINTDINYLTSSRAKNMLGRVSVLRLGRRIAFVEAVGWQDSEERPVAKATFRIRIGEDN